MPIDITKALFTHPVSALPKLQFACWLGNLIKWGKKNPKPNTKQIVKYKKHIVARP